MKNIFSFVFLACFFLAGKTSAQTDWNTFTTNNGNIQLGPSSNNGYGEIYTTANYFLFNKPLYATDGKFSSYGSANLYLQAGGINRLTILKANGRVGVGVTAPTARLHVQNSAANTPAFRVEQLHANGVGMDVLVPANTSKALSVQTGANVNFRVMGDGKTYAREVEVTLAPFPDYVFGSDYPLMPLNQLKNYIADNGHLPNIPSAEAVKDHGIGLGQLGIKQMEKIEELTLYILQLNERLEKLEQENAALRSKK